MVVAGPDKYLQARIVQVLWKQHPEKIADEKKLYQLLEKDGEDPSAVLAS
jgi:hypothetical protein